MTLDARFGVARFGESYFGYISDTTPAVFDESVALSLKSGGRIVNVSTKDGSLTLRGADKLLNV